ncbi:hypothetical protein [Alkalicoccobacillus plakortidis]|uniref:DUF4367 domain-containing protein n=1 Tax=Alkalicoccobacillus plakortidis TaxID=444060 RepID=A0ABT0XHA1_9BACI|nr:hypothetical protein [Alkalicoccobacillus plakortidis]MCM2675085.1 hypothetical protein [Alkalicoccobacillus plakortidis]
MQDFDEKLKETIKRHTSVSEHDKKEVFLKLEQSIYHNQNEKGRRNRTWAFRLLAPIPVLALFWIGFDQMRPVLQPEELPRTSSEPIQEKTMGDNVSFSSDQYDEKVVEYLLYLSDSDYKWVETESGLDRIEPSNPLPEGYPDVFLTIEQNTSVSPEETIERIFEDVNSVNVEVGRPEEVTEPIEGFRLYVSNGTEWDSLVQRFYVLSNGNEGSFIITQSFFLEAIEGHGANFEEIVRNFELVENN